MCKKYTISIPVLFVLFLLIQGNDAQFNVTLPGDAPLIASLLQNLTIPVSDFPMYVAPLSANVNVSNTLCTNLTASSIYIQLNMENSTSPENPTQVQFTLLINATLNAVTANCTGNFTYLRNTIPKLSGAGTLNMSLDNSSSISLVMAISRNFNQTVQQKSEGNFGIDEFAKMVENLKAGNYDPYLNLVGEYYNEQQTMKSTSGEYTEAPVYQASNASCDIYVSVNYLNSTDSTINSNLRSVIPAVEQTVPGVLCSDFGLFIQNNVTSVLNLVSYSLFSFVKQTRAIEFPRAYNTEAKYFFVAFSLLWLGMFLFYVFFGFFFKLFMKRDVKSRKGESIGILQKQMGKKSKQSANAALITNTEINPFFRYGILLFLLWNIALFASATISVAASVYLYIQVTDTILPISSEPIKTNSLYSFTLISSVREMWDAGVWPLSLLIAVTSGFWPYIKLVLMFFCWITPGSAKIRGKLLFVLDVLGKWSLIDAYVLVLFINAFRVPIKFAIPYFGTFNIDMVVQVQYAYYSYLVATMCSLALTHILLYFHHHVSEPPIPKDTKRESLNNHHFKLKSRMIDIVYSFTILGKVTIVLLLVIAIGACIAACSIKSFAITYEGSLVGYMLDVTGGNSAPTYSIFELTKALPDTTYYDPGEIGIRVIQVTFAMFAYTIPLAFIFSLILIWWIPLSSVGQHVSFVIVEVLNAWSAVDVFIVAIIVALLELEQFAKFIIAGKCTEIDKLIAIIAPNVDNPTCFNVRATLSLGTWLLLLSVIVLVIIGYFVMFLCNKAITERLENERERNSSSQINSKHSDPEDDGEDIFDSIKSNLESIASFSGALSTSVGGIAGILRKLSCIRVFRVFHDDS